MRIVQFCITPSLSYWTQMFFRFEFYPADLLNVINGKSDEDAGRIIRQWVIGLIGNNTECIGDSSARL
jgi:hypothetical protein